MKALLLDSTGEFHDDHSLRQLLAKLKSKGVELRVDAKQRTTLSRLDEFHRLRYPDVVDSPSVGDLDFIAVHSLFSALGEQLPQALKNDLLTLDRTKKFGRVLMRKPKRDPPFQGHIVVVDSDK